MDAREFFQKVVVPRYFRRRWSRPLPRPLLCPICKSPVVQELNRTGDAIGYHCATHSAFKVAHTVFAEQRSKNYSREQWEAALRKANQRKKPGELPLITSNDF